MDKKQALGLYIIAVIMMVLSVVILLMAMDKVNQTEDWAKEFINECNAHYNEQFRELCPQERPAWWNVTVPDLITSEG